MNLNEGIQGNIDWSRKGKIIGHNFGCRAAMEHAKWRLAFCCCPVHSLSSYLETLCNRIRTIQHNRPFRKILFLGHQPAHLGVLPRWRSVSAAAAAEGKNILCSSPSSLLLPPAQDFFALGRHKILCTPQGRTRSCAGPRAAQDHDYPVGNFC